MAKFRVKLSALVNAEVTIDILAFSKEDAVQKAHDTNPDSLFWELCDVYEVTQIEALEPPEENWKVTYNNGVIAAYTSLGQVKRGIHGGVRSIEPVR